jgi:DNA-binding YbaB/EbfC family protein
MANPFSAAKDIYKLRSEAKKMQEDMKQILVTGESKKGLVKVTLNGAQEMVDVNMNDEIMDDKLELKKHIKDAYADAQKKLQKEMMKGMDLDKLKAMLGQ